MANYCSVTDVLEITKEFGSEGNYDSSLDLNPIQIETAITEAMDYVQIGKNIVIAETEPIPNMVKRFTALIAAKILLTRYKEISNSEIIKYISKQCSKTALILAHQNRKFGFSEAQPIRLGGVLDDGDRKY